MRKLNRKIKRFPALALCLTLLLCIAAPATADGSELDDAVRFVTEQKIFEGDDNGNLNLDSGLTRAELAVILTRLEFSQPPGDLSEWEAWGRARFSDPETRYNKFSDVPDWALPYIEYCYQMGYMRGVGGNLFDPQGTVNPKMACTVMLRYCRIAVTDWDYDTSVSKAQALGIAPADGVSGDTILRGTMAVVIHKGIQHVEAASPPPVTTPDPVPTPTPALPEETPLPAETTAMTTDEMKAEIVRLTNEARVAAGVQEVEVLSELMDCAQLKAQDMLDNNYLGHISPVYGSANDMIKALVPGYNGACENFNIGGKTATEAFESWEVSAEHYKNLIDSRVTHIGVGIVKNSKGTLIWVQQLMRK